MHQKVFVYAQPHDDRGSDKVLVIKEPKREVFTLPQADVPKDKYPEWVACEVLETQTGLGLYPDDHRGGGIIFREPMEFIRLPHLEGRLLSSQMEVLCYSMEVNESRPLTGNAVWLPWWSLRWDDRTSTMMRFIMALLYAGISGWEMKLDEQGNWTLPYLCTEGRKNHTVDEILSGEVKVEVHDSFEDIIRKQTERHLAKYRKPEEKKEEPVPPKEDNWLFRLLRAWKMLGE